MTGVVAATAAYEAWLAKKIPLIPADLAFKHEQMKLGAFPFFRATYYRWCVQWASALPGLQSAPVVPSVGDLHLENFGTWRDTEGRLVWGVNDFDEASSLPFTNDLVRLAASIRLAQMESSVEIRFSTACRNLLSGYRSALTSGGKPFVLAEENVKLRMMATGVLRDPVPFWQRAEALPTSPPTLASQAKAAFSVELPPANTWAAKSRRAGLGSLGHPRILFITQSEGGHVAREAKRLAPSAVYWASETKASLPSGYEATMRGAVRCQDPFVVVKGSWLLRRLAPDCSRIELSHLPKARDEKVLVSNMGFEAGNIHLGQRGAAKEILAHLDRLPEKWLKKSADQMVDLVLKDFERWRDKV